MTTLAIQTALKTRGYDPGPLDGVRGRRTISAIKGFQADHGLTVDGLAGPKTLAKLLGTETVQGREVVKGGGGTVAAGQQQMRPWYEEALRLKGTREGPGTADNPLLLRWAKALGLGGSFAHDSVAWCGLLVAHCIAASLPDEPLPTNPLGARNWLQFGIRCEPTLGAVLVFWRGSRSGWQGHVGFYAGEDATAFHVLGGNQSDAVTVTRIARDRLLGARWPKSVPLGSAQKIAATAGGALSTNEA